MTEVVYCFSHDDVAVIHLKGTRDSKTLCGKRAFAEALPGDRRRVTCVECRKRKPRVLGGGSQ